MQRERVDSSGIVSVGYDDWSKTLEIEYAGGAVYDYFRVPELLYRDLLAADSKGRFVNFYIKPYFQYEDIAQRRSPARRFSASASPGGARRAGHPAGARRMRRHRAR